MNHDVPLYWYQGQLLQPQHLQHTDQLNARRVAHALDSFVPHGWGMENVQVAESALPGGQFVLASLTARFRDGTWVQYPGNALVEARSFSAGELAEHARVVYVGIRRMAPGEANCSVFTTRDDAARASTRFAALTEPDLVADNLAGAAPAQVRPMYHVLRLFWNTELDELAQYDLLPVAALDMVGGNVRLAPAFVPPVVNLGASAALTQTVRNVRDELLGRAHQLEGNKMAADMMTVGIDSAQLRVMMALALFSRYAPLLSQLVETAQTHPWHVYGVLRQLAGELSLFSSRFDMLGRGADGKAAIEPYRHEDAGGQIAAIAAFITTMLNEITFGPDQVIPLERVDDVWTADLPESFVTGRNRYYLIVSGIDDAETGTAFAQQARLATPSELPKLVSHALAGLELLHLAVPPAGMPRRHDASCFRIETVSDGWAAVVRERGIALFYGGASETLAAELVMVRR